MKKNLKKLLILLTPLLLLAMYGCGGGGGSATEMPGLVKAVGYYFDNIAPDYPGDGVTCDLEIYLYYSPTLSANDIDTFTLTSSSGQRWTANTKQFGTDSSNRPYVNAWFCYGANPATFPLAGTWTVELQLKNGQTSTYQKTFHEPGSTAAATHAYIYSPEDYSPADGTLFAPSLRRFPAGGYTVSYDPALNEIVSSGLATVLPAYQAAEPRAYNMFCWLYDANKTYLGLTIRQFAPADHSASGLISSGELSIVPAATSASTGTVDLTQVKFIRFVAIDGAQYAPGSYTTIDYRSISYLVPVN